MVGKITGANRSQQQSNDKFPAGQVRGQVRSGQRSGQVMSGRLSQGRRNRLGDATGIRRSYVIVAAVIVTIISV